MAASASPRAAGRNASSPVSGTTAWTAPRACRPICSRASPTAAPIGASAHRYCAGSSRLGRRARLFVEKLLYRLEKLQAVLFHHHGVRAFADLHVALVRRVGELLEVGVEHVVRRVLIPFGVREERRHADIGGDVKGA